MRPHNCDSRSKESVEWSTEGRGGAVRSSGVPIPLPRSERWLTFRQKTYPFRRPGVRVFGEAVASHASDAIFDSRSALRVTPLVEAYARRRRPNHVMSFPSTHAAARLFSPSSFPHAVFPSIVVNCCQWRLPTRNSHHPQEGRVMRRDAVGRRRRGSIATGILSVEESVDSHVPSDRRSNTLLCQSREHTGQRNGKLWECLQPDAITLND